MTLDGRTANQLKDVGNKLNTGAKVLEVQGTSAAILEAIPKQHMKEIGRQMKLAGVAPTMHGPIVEASGVGNQGFDEGARIKAERQLTSALIRGNELDNKGNVSVTTHSTAGLPEMEEMTKVMEDGKEKEKLGNILIIDPRSGRINAIKSEKRFFPQKGEFEEKGKEFDAQEEIKRHNKNSWIQSLSDINRHTSWGEQTIQEVTSPILKRKDVDDETTNKLIADIANANIDEIDSEEIKRLGGDETLKQMQRSIRHGELYLRDAYQNMKQMFDIAYENALKEKNEKDIEQLQEYARRIAPQVTEDLEKDPAKLINFAEGIEDGIKILKNIETPKTVVPLKDFVLDKSTQTFANAATESYKKYKDKAPILNIENPPAGGGLSRAEDIIQVVEKSREKMTQNLIKEGLSESKAKKAAEKSIGATWDVGHINMLRGKGYSEEDIVKETEKIAPYVKHVHLSDNFGYEHTELPMGMGNVPVKEMMKRLGEKGFSGKKIVEAIQWYEHFQDAPGQPPKGGGHALTQSYQAFDSPIYTTGTGYSWGQMPGLSVYTTAAGQGALSPPVSQSMYGTTFSTLPAELGGNIGGDQSRISGTPNQ